MRGLFGGISKRQKGAEKIGIPKEWLRSLKKSKKVSRTFLAGHSPGDRPIVGLGSGVERDLVGRYKERIWKGGKGVVVVGSGLWAEGRVERELERWWWGFWNILGRGGRERGLRWAWYKVE